MPNVINLIDAKNAREQKEYEDFLEAQKFWPLLDALAQKESATTDDFDDLVSSFEHVGYVLQKQIEEDDGRGEFFAFVKNMIIANDHR